MNKYNKSVKDSVNEVLNEQIESGRLSLDELKSLAKSRVGSTHRLITSFIVPLASRKTSTEVLAETALRYVRAYKRKELSKQAKLNTTSTIEQQ